MLQFHVYHHMTTNKKFRKSTSRRTSFLRFLCSQLYYHKNQGSTLQNFYIHLPEAQPPDTPRNPRSQPGPGGWDTYEKFWNDTDATLPQSHPQSDPRSPLVWRHLRTRSAHGDGSHSPAIQRWGNNQFKYKQRILRYYQVQVWIYVQLTSMVELLNQLQKLTTTTNNTNHNNNNNNNNKREFRTDRQPRIRARRRHPVGKKDLVGSKDPEFPGKRVQWSMEKETCAFQNTASQWLSMFLEIVFKQNKPICLLLFGLCAPF